MILDFFLFLIHFLFFIVTTKSNIFRLLFFDFYKEDFS
ncbi:hypothetical protein BGAFAR04_K0006 (plasmid) [Borreliella garinii Far04]|nr:hypothetical protein BGAFAR04_K0006 [Borreliella garinii Far04]